jgi:cytochrome c
MNGTIPMRNARHIPCQLTVIATLFLSASSAPAQDNARDERRGERLLTKNCSMCHAIGRSGRSPHREAPPFRTLSTRYPIEDLAEALGEGLFTGHPDMPEFVFSPRDVGSILSYLRSIQRR